MGRSGEYIGKEKIATIAYEVVCTHHKRIISCTWGHPGARNDKTIVKYDNFIASVRKGAYTKIKVIV